MNQKSVLTMPRPKEPDAMTSHELRERTLSVLFRMEAISQRNNAHDISRRLADLRTRFEENRFQLAVVGQFKRGKTSVLNALLGNEILPVGAIPFTSIVTMVKYGESSDVRVVFQTGERSSIPIAELSDYVSETGNPGNSKGVDHVEVSYPSDYLDDGAALINCPGFGSPYDQTTRLAYDFLPEIDAAIFVTSPDPPLTSAEIGFLTKLAATVTRVFVVMNKADVVDHRSLAAVLEYTTHAVSTALGQRTPVYVVSAKQALTYGARKGDMAFGGPGFRHLEQDLRHFLETETRKVFHASISGSVLSVLSDLRMHLQLRTETAKASAQDFQSKFMGFDADLKAALEEQQKHELSLMARISQLCTLVDSETVRFGESRSSSVILAIKAFVAQCAEINRADLLSSLDRFVGWQIQRTLDEWRPDFESSLGKAARDAFTRYLESMDAVTYRIRRAAFEVFRVELKRIRIDERPLFIPSHYQTETSTGMRPGRVSALLPDPLFQWFLLRKAILLAPLEMQRNTGLLAKDLKLHLEREATEFCGRVRKRLCEIIEAARTALNESSRHQRSAENWVEPTLQLSRDLDDLDHIAKELKAGLGVEYAVEA